MRFSAYPGSILRLTHVIIVSCYVGGSFAAEQLEEIVVTAQKREERLQDVPIAITALSRAQLEVRGIEGTAALNGAAPSLYVNTSPSASTISTISLRGSVSDAVGIYMDPVVATYVDGVYIGKNQGGLFDVVDLERVEVLRGPQGTLFGRNTLAGAVNFVTRKPSGTFGGSFGVDVGNYAAHVERLSLDLPKMGPVAVSVGLRDEGRDGWLDNSTAGSPDLGELDKQAYRVSATMDVSASVQIDYKFDGSNINNSPIPISYYRASGWLGPAELDRNALFALWNIGLVPGTGAASYASEDRPTEIGTTPGVSLWEQVETTGHALTLRYTVNDQNTVKYIASHREMDFTDQVDLDSTPVPLFSYNRNTTYEADSHELQWVGSTDRLNYVIGYYYFEDDGDTTNPQVLGGPPAEFSFESDFGSTSEADALFGQIDYKLTDALTATVGVRRTSEKKTVHSVSYGTEAFKGDKTYAFFPEVRNSASFDAITPTYALAYRVNEDINVYARLAQGFQSGGFSAEAGDPSYLAEPYDPQESKTYELGSKASLWDGRAQVNGAIFLNEITDMLIPQLVPGSTSSYWTNAGKATNRGLELEVVVIPLEDWRVQVGYSWLDAKFDEYYDNALNIPERPLIDTANNRLPSWTPEHTLNVNVDARLARTAWGTLRGIVDFTYQSKVYAYAVNDSLSAPNAGGAYSAAADELPSRSNINVRLQLSELSFGGDGVADISIWIRNLADTDEPSTIIDFGNFTTATWTEPRMYGASFSYKW